MTQPPTDSDGRSQPPEEALSPTETAAAQSLAVIDSRCETVLQLIGDSEVADSVRTTCGDLERALITYIRERLARAAPACAPEIIRVCNAISAERS